MAQAVWFLIALEKRSAEALRFFLGLEGLNNVRN